MYTQKPSQDTNCAVAGIDTPRIIEGMKTWQDDVKDALKRKKMSQMDLIEPLGVTTRGAVGHYLNKRRQPSVDQMRVFAELLGITLEQILEADSQVFYEAPVKKPVKVIRNRIVQARERERRFRQLAEAQSDPSALIENLLKIATPRGAKVLAELSEIAKSGELQESDIQIIEAICSRYRKKGPS